MHLNALYREAEAGKRALADCAHELLGASKWRARTVVGAPPKIWHLRQARQHLERAKQHLVIVRDNVPLLAAIGAKQQIDSSGGFAICDLLSGGLLGSLASVTIGWRVAPAQLAIDELLAQIHDVMLRMRKAGAVS